MDSGRHVRQKMRMSSLRQLVPVVIALSACPPPVTQPPPEPPLVEDPVAYADPRVGTGGFGFNFGSAFPGACAPNGLAKVGPDTSGPYGTINFLHYSGYWAGDDVVRGFSHLHLHGTGATDYGVLSLMPTVKPISTAIPEPGDHQSLFDKAGEVAEPGYYAVTLDEGPVRVELTATPHVGHHRITFPQDAAQRTLIVDLDRTLSGGRVTDADLTLFPSERRISGRLHHVGGMTGGTNGYDVFFEIRVKDGWTSHVAWRAGMNPASVDTVSGAHVGAALSFDATAVEVQVGISFVSTDGARRNLDAETPAFDFDGTRQATRDAWKSILSTVRVYGGTEKERRTFYSNLHHGYMMPSVVADADGQYRGHVRLVHTAQGFRYVTDLSLWDTYRTLNPLYVLLTPSIALDVVKSLHAMAREGGFFPKWPLGIGDAGTMIGASAEIVVADTYVKGVRDFDVMDAYARLRAAAMDPTPPPGGRGGRNHVEPYMMLGYVPADRRPSVSLTTEYGHSDFAMAELARALGNLGDESAFRTRSRGYRALFDSATGFLRARNADGSLASTGAFDPIAWTDDFAEANAWQSVWMAQHDVAGLVELFGGPAHLIAKLEEFFERAKADHDALNPDDVILTSAMPRPYYFHGNEPDIHAAYLFSQLARRDLTARWVHWIRTTLYSDGFDGLAGNDDGGTLGGWYVFGALGFFPIPGSDRYIIGTPLFPKVEIAVPGGAFTVEAKGVSERAFHPRSVKLDGVELTSNELLHSQIRAGSRLVFEMGETP